MEFCSPYSYEMKRLTRLPRVANFSCYRYWRLLGCADRSAGRDCRVPTIRGTDHFLGPFSHSLSKYNEVLRCTASKTND
jgi:hypothetical protein